MIIDFRQGIIAYPTSSGLQRFLEFSDGFVGINAADGRTDVTFANGDENYLHNETTSISAAWGPITPNVDAWLYWNLNGLTAQRTFGVTYVQPVVSSTVPPSPANDLHWFDTIHNIMRVYTSGKWVTRIRTFACKINNATISPMGSGVINRPFAGTQVGIQGVNIPVGRIIVDDQGQPIRKQNGQLFTTEDEFFINGSPINTIRLEANVFQAQAVENIAKYQPVKFVDFGKVALATYNDTYTTTIAMAMEDIIGGDIGTLCMQGVISSPDWNWPVVGKPLWIHGSIPGLLVDYDPHVQSAGTYKVAKPPVGRVVSQSSIFFDQGLGGKGDKGDTGDATVPLATTTVFGISKLSVDATDPANPIVVTDNDPRNFNDRYPLPHNQAATTIIPSPTGILTGVNLQQTLQIINDSFVKRTGDSMTGYLILSADPAQDMHASTKHYVDTRTLDSLADVTIANPTTSQALVYNGSEWVNSSLDGSLWRYRSEISPDVLALCQISFTYNNAGPAPA